MSAGINARPEAAVGVAPAAASVVVGPIASARGTRGICGATSREQLRLIALDTANYARHFPQKAGSRCTVRRPSLNC